MLRVFNSTARYVDQGGNKVHNTVLHIYYICTTVYIHCLKKNDTDETRLRNCLIDFDEIWTLELPP